MAKKVVVGVIAGVIVLGVAGAVTWLFMNGTLSWGAPKQAAAVRIVCDEDIISRYNQASMFASRDDSLVSTRDEQGMRDVAQSIKESDGSGDDATCQTILFWVAVMDKNTAEAQTAYDTIASLHERALYANNNLLGIDSLTQYKDAISSLAPAESSESQGATSDQ